jgi:hypothetical protein
MKTLAKNTTLGPSKIINKHTNDVDTDLLVDLPSDQSLKQSILRLVLAGRSHLTTTEMLELLSEECQSTIKIDSKRKNGKICRKINTKSLRARKRIENLLTRKDKMSYIELLYLEDKN